MCIRDRITEGNATVKETLSQLADLIAGTKNTPDDTQAAGQTEKKLTQLLASKELGQLLKLSLIHISLLRHNRTGHFCGISPL